MMELQTTRNKHEPELAEMLRDCQFLYTTRSLDWLFEYLGFAFKMRREA